MNIKTNTDNTFATICVMLCLFIVLTISFFVFWTMAAFKLDCMYATTTIVDRIDKSQDIVTLKDYNGYIYQISPVEDWEVGDIASILMDDNGTPFDKLDDKIVSVKYSGTALKFYCKSIFQLFVLSMGLHLRFSQELAHLFLVSFLDHRFKR